MLISVYLQLYKVFYQVGFYSDIFPLGRTNCSKHFLKRDLNTKGEVRRMGLNKFILFLGLFVLVLAVICVEAKPGLGVLENTNKGLEVLDKTQGVNFNKQLS